MARIHQLWYSLPLKVRDIISRASKTFIQAFIAAVPLAALANADLAVIKATAFSAAAAGVSAVWNTIKTPPSGEAILIPVHPDNLFPKQQGQSTITVIIVVCVILIALRVFGVI